MRVRVRVSLLRVRACVGHTYQVGAAREGEGAAAKPSVARMVMTHGGWGKVGHGLRATPPSSLCPPPASLAIMHATPGPPFPSSMPSPSALTLARQHQPRPAQPCPAAPCSTPLIIRPRPSAPPPPPPAALCATPGGRHTQVRLEAGPRGRAASVLVGLSVSRNCVCRAVGGGKGGGGSGPPPVSITGCRWSAGCMPCPGFAARLFLYDASRRQSWRAARHVAKHPIATH